MHSPSLFLLKLKTQSHLWTIWFLIYYSPPLHWWALSCSCQGNNLAPVYLRYVNMLFLFWALAWAIGFPEIKHWGVFNILFLIRPGNTPYLYSLSSSFCCSSEHFTTLAKFRLISCFFCPLHIIPRVIHCSLPGHVPVKNMVRNPLMWGQRAPGFPQESQGSLQSSWSVPKGQDRRFGKILPRLGSVTHRMSRGTPQCQGHRSSREPQDGE